MTPYPEVTAALEEMRDAVKGVLGDRLVAIYAYGSLALGGFNLSKSDLDLVAVTADELNEAEFAALEKMHVALYAGGSKWLREIEMYYVPQAAMAKFDRAHPPRPRLHEGKFSSMWQGDDWVLHRHVLREKGIVIHGPPPATMIGPVSRDDIRRAVSIGIVKNWWLERVTKNPARLEGDMYRAHAFLTLCRALHTHDTGEQLPKRDAAAWALPRLEEKFRPLVQQAIAWQPGAKMAGTPGDAIAFIQYIAGKTG